MGYITCLGYCIGCGGFMSFNPDRVPSIRINGVREPLCENCVHILNERAKAAGQPEFRIPSGAYEPAPEEELSREVEL